MEKFSQLVENSIKKCKETQTNNSVFENPRINSTLSQFNLRSKTLHVSLNKQNNHNKQNNLCLAKQTFRSFIQTKRSYKINKQRKTHMNFKQEMQALFEYLQKNQNQFDPSLLLKTKQKIMLNFFNNFIQKLSQRNLDQAQILVLVWNNLFFLIEKALQKVCYFSKLNEKINLNEQIDTHQKYQKVFLQYKKQKQQLIKQSEKRQKFTKILVAKLRQYKRLAKKLEQTLRLASDKLNQFRNGYLEIQIQCINLTMELKNIGSESAKQMVNKKMSLLIQKSKQYKILPSKKKAKMEAKAFSIISHSLQNQKIKQQFFEIFKTNFKQHPDVMNKLVGRAIQAILDNEQSLPIDYQIFNQNLVEKHQGQIKVDKETDMQGFEIDRADKKVGINPQQRYFSQMTRMKGVQTQQVQKQVLPKTESCGFQCDYRYIKINKFCLKRSYDLSFLFQNTLKSSNIKRQQRQLKSSIIVQNLLNQKPKRKFNQKNYYTYYPEHDLNNQNYQNEVASQSSSQQAKNTTIYSKITQQAESDIKLREPFEIKRKLRKIATTFSNKVSFINNYANYVYDSQSKQKNSQSLNLIDQSVMKQSSFQTIKDSLNLIQQKQHKQKQKQKQQTFKQKIAQTIKKLKTKTDDMQSVRQLKQSKQRKRDSHNRRNIKTSLAKVQVIKKTMNQTKKQYRKINKQTSLTHSQKNSQKQIKSPAKNQQKRIKSLHGFNMKKALQINQELVYNQIFEQVQKLKNIPIQTSRKTSRLKNICKIIDLVFQMACKQYERTNTTKNFLFYIYQAINNSFGVANIKHIHKKVISFIKQIFQQKEQNSQLKLFTLMLGLTQQGQKNTQHSNFNNQLILRIAKKISNNWRYPLKLSQLVINSQNIEQNIEKQLQQSGFCYNFRFEIINNLHELGISNYQGFQISQMLAIIAKFIIDKQNIIIISYQPIMELLQTNEKDTISFQFISFLIQLHFLSDYQNRIMLSKLSAFLSRIINEKQIKKSQFAYFCCQVGILDFSRLFHRSLAIFKLKQNKKELQCIDSSILRKQNFQKMPKQIIYKIFQNCQKIDQSNTLFHSRIKKNLLILLYLKIQDYRSNKILQQIIGKDIKNLYNLTLLYLI